jgi:hypothetical protein
MIRDRDAFMKNGGLGAWRRRQGNLKEFGRGSNQRGRGQASELRLCLVNARASVCRSNGEIVKRVMCRGRWREEKSFGFLSF